jgi:pullulanase
MAVASMLDRKQTHFMLWRPGSNLPAPKLVIGKFNAGPPPKLDSPQTIALVASPMNGGLAATDLWEVDAAKCNLTDGQVYHYWFEIVNTNPDVGGNITLRITDPAAYTVDWRIMSDVVPGFPTDPRNDGSARAPAGVIRWLNGKLVPTDAEAVPLSFEDSADQPMVSLPANNRLVIYELPTAWTKTGDAVNATNIGVGTFQDVLALVRKSAAPASFSGVAVLAAGNSHLQNLGINALELLPPADSFADRSKWGYATSNYFAPDFDLGQPIGQAASTATSDFLNLVRGCHLHGIRFIYDAVMAFGHCDPYRYGNFLPFHVDYNASPPDPEKGGRDGFGGDLWKYAYPATSIDPISGNVTQLYPARQHLLMHMQWWMRYYHIDGYRLDSVNNINNYDFVNTFRTGARAVWNERWINEGNAAGGADARFITVGEELAMPSALLGFIDGMWNEKFRNRVRNAIIGRNAEDQPSFEWSVREMIDCRALKDQNSQTLFWAGYQAVNYLGSHDLTNKDGDGTNNDRIYSYLDRMGVASKDKPLKLAFVCLLTAVGIPMILAGDEFASPMAFTLSDPHVDDAKQMDPVNYDLLSTDPWRQQIFDYVARLVKFRTTSDALSVDDTDFIHVDLAPGKRIMAWKRGGPAHDPVVVVANFSDWGSDVSQPGAEYRINNWPTLPAGKKWVEITQGYSVGIGWEGREPIYPWEAKVYAAV